MASKKAGGVTVAAQGHNIDKLTLELPLDAKKAAAIQRCIAKGSLKITLSKVNLAAGRLSNGYIYD